MDILNPERIVLGSIFSRAEEYLRPAMERVLEQECLFLNLDVCRILPAALGESLGDIDALCVTQEV